MATAKSRVLTLVRGKIDNSRPHYAFVRNGKQFIGCVRNGWNSELTTDTQKITALNFAYATAISNMINAVSKAGKSTQTKTTISYLFRLVKVGKKTYFFDDTLFTQVNAAIAHYFDPAKAGSQFFVTTTDPDNLDAIPRYEVAAPYAQAFGDKSALRYALASFLMNHADRVNLPQMYNELSSITGAQFDETEIYPLSDVYEVHGLLMLNLYQWAKVPVYDITPENYDKYIAERPDHRRDFPQFVAEQAFPKYNP